MTGRRELLAGILATLAALGSAHAESAADVPEADRAAIQATIEAQLAAFRANDAYAAFAHASPMIQGLFETPDRFMAMVRTLYPPVWRSRTVEFTALVERDGRLVQKVELTGPDGAPALALYTMIRDAAGWRIDGCMLAESEKPAA